jgi:hypothetical protein
MLVALMCRERVGQCRQRLVHDLQFKLEHVKYAICRERADYLCIMSAQEFDSMQST